MDLRYSRSDETFRAHLRAWLKEAVREHGEPPAPGDWAARRQYDTGWQRRLFEAGYAGINWPAEYGGVGASLTQEILYYEELARAGAPDVPVNFVGMRHGGPTLIAEGTERQKRAHLPRILRGDEVWCQGFSEPGAGSDLASLRTSAVRFGDHYVVSGQKIWTSTAQCADFCELLVRTDPDAPKHRGISWLILPMEASGIDIRPLKTIVGEHDFSELFLDNVRVPVENRVGEENDGWRITNVTLRFERGTAWMTDIFYLKRFVEELAAAAAESRPDTGSSNDVLGEIGHLDAQVGALMMWVRRSVSETAQTGLPGLAGSGIKLAFTELLQEAYELGIGMLGRAALARSDIGDTHNRRILYRYLQSLSLTIAAGTSQIQRNIIAERILGLPKERR